MSDQTVIQQTLELLADKVDDLTPYVYRHFYARCPQAEPLMQDKPDFMQGKMLNELIQAVIDVADERTYLPVLLETGVKDHNVWGVTAPMYNALFAAFIDAMHEILGNEFTAEMLAVWNAKFAAIKTMVDPHAATHAANAE